MNEADLLKLFNGVLKIAKPIATDSTFPKSLDDLFAELDIDSLDFLLLGVYMGEIFGVPEEVMKEKRPEIKSVSDFFEFVQKHKTKDVESVDAVLETVK
jgi:acyl carrier protein